MNAPPVDVIDKLGTLGFRAAPEALRSLLETSTRGRASPTEVCERLVELERRARDTTNLDRRTRAATLGTFCTLERFDWNHPRSIDKALYERLLTLDFLEKGHNVLLRGQSGVGKTTLVRIPAKWNTRSGRSGTPVPEQAEQSERQRRWPVFTSPPSWPGSNSRPGCAPTRP